MNDEMLTQVRRMGILNTSLKAEISLLKRRIYLLETKPYVMLKRENERMKRKLKSIAKTVSDYAEDSVDKNKTCR